MKYKFILLFIAIAGTIIISTGLLIANKNKETIFLSSDKTIMVTEKTFELKTNMRKLWEDHVVWTRNVIFGIIDDLPGLTQALDRLQKNQDAIGNAIKPFYGADAANKLAELLHEHISLAGEVLKAVKTNDDIAIEIANKKWFANADEIADFLSSANPNWRFEEMKKMMYDHLNLTSEEAIARKKKDYNADIAAYDKVHDEILEMSDMLSDGIIKQFPDKFKEGVSIGMKED